MTIDPVLVLQVIAAAAPFLAGLWLKNYLSNFMNEKGRNLATKEDIRGITERIENVKAQIDSRLHVHKARYEFELRILQALAEKIVALRDATMGLRPVADSLNSNEPEEKKRRFNAWKDAALALYYTAEHNQPFMPRELCSGLQVFMKKAQLEQIGWELGRPDKDDDYWKVAEENQRTIDNLTAAIRELIRARAKEWEKFEPGPES